MTTTSCTRFSRALRHQRERFFDRIFQRDFLFRFPEILDHVRTVGELAHVEGRDIAQRDLDAFFRTCGGDATDRIRRALGNVRRAVDRIDRDIELWRSRQPRPQLFAFKNSRRVVLDALADDDLAADVHEIEHSAHGIARRVIGFFFFAASEPA